MKKRINLSKKRGRPSSTTLGKIKELDVVVNPNYLSYRPNADGILIRTGSKANNLEMHLPLSAVGYDERALFYAAAGVRNYMIRNKKRPDEKSVNKIIERSKHTQEHKKIWLDTSKSKQPKIELTKDKTEIKINIPELIKPKGETMSKTTKTTKTEQTVTNPNKYIWLNKKTGIMSVRIKYDGKFMTKSVSLSKFNNEEEAWEALRAIRDVMVETGKKPSKVFVNSLFTVNKKEPAAKKLRATKKQSATKKQPVDKKPIPSEVNPPQKTEDGIPLKSATEQQPAKSDVIKEPGLFKKFINGLKTIFP